ATANRNLMQAVGGPPGELGSMVGARKVELFNIRFPRGLNTVRRDPTAPEVLTLLFAESQVRSRYVPAIPAVRAIANVVPITSPAVYPAVSLPGRGGAGLPGGWWGPAWTPGRSRWRCTRPCPWPRPSTSPSPVVGSRPGW